MSSNEQASIRGFRITNGDKPAKDTTPSHLRLTEDGAIAVDELKKAVKEHRAPCFNRPDIFTDYDEPPTDEYARLACAGCPLLAQCKEMAELTKPAWGIQAGSVYGRENA